MQDDLISRTDAIEFYAYEIPDPKYANHYVVDVDDLKNMPSVMLKQKVGEWVMKSNRYKVCSECDTYFDTWSHELPYDKFCPNCGAKMKKEGSE